MVFGMVAAGLLTVSTSPFPEIEACLLKRLLNAFSTYAFDVIPFIGPGEMSVGDHASAA
jgi:hypothetical protein